MINITNHGYFNLNGYASNIDDHTLQISASKFGCVDLDGLYTGQLKMCIRDRSDRDRKMTIMTTTFIPCGAKMPIIGLIAGAIFHGDVYKRQCVLYVEIKHD